MSTYTQVGTNTQGIPALLAPAAAAWWTLFDQLVRNALGITLRIVQARGDYTGSAETHADGWAIDLQTIHLTRSQTLEVVRLAREAGAPATWWRLTVGSGPHIHLVINAGFWTRSSYQTDAVKAGRDGLGAGGKAGPDTHPKPTQWRTHTQGIAWMRTQLKEDEMTPAQEAKLDRLLAIETETQARVTKALTVVAEALAVAADVKAVAVENQRRIGWQAKTTSISDQIAGIK